MLFVSFIKGPGGFPYVFIITGEVPTLIPVDGITLGDHWVFVLRGDQEVFDGAATFEVSLDTIPTTDLFDTFTKTLCVRYNYVTLTLNFSGSSRGTVGSLVVNPINGLTGRLVEPFLHFVQSPSQTRDAISQAGSPQSSQAGSSQLSLGDSALPQSNLSQAGSSQTSLVDSTLSPAESAISQAGSSQSSQAGSSQLSPGDSNLPQSNLSHTGSSQASPVDSTLPPAESAFSKAGSPQPSQAGSSHLSPGDSVLPQGNLSQADSSQASPVDSTLSPAESELSQGSSSQSSPEDSALP